MLFVCVSPLPQETPVTLPPVTEGVSPVDSVKVPVRVKYRSPDS